MRPSISAATALFVLAAAGGLQAQSPFSLELRGGAAFPTADFGDATLKTGGGFEFNAGVLLMPQLKVYGGWGWNELVTDRPFRGGSYDVETTGYVFGAQFQHPVLQRVGGFVRAGGMYQHIELETRDGALFSDSGKEFGWEAGGGLIVPLGDRFAFTPGVRYRTLSVDLTVGQQVVPVDLSYVALDLGLTASFGSRPLLTALLK